ncbi:MAG: cytochrome P450 [Chloroflexota bacterium]
MTHHPPTITSWQLIKSLPTLRKDLFRFLLNAREEYGDIYTLSLGLTKIIILNHPEHVKRVFLSESANYIKGGPMWEGVANLVGTGLAVSNGEFWRKQRRLIQPQFHKRRLAALTGLMVAAIDESLAEWDLYAVGKRLFDAEEAFARITLNVFVKTMFGEGIRPDEVDEVRKAFNFITDYILRGVVTNQLPAWVPVPGQRRYQQAVATIDRVLLEIVDQRREAQDVSGDLMSLLLDAVDEETGEGMSHEQLRTEAVTLFLGGYETNTTALMWMLHLLMHHPQILARLYEEVDRALGGRTPTFADLSSLPYSRMVLQETLRLYPSAWWLMRIAVEDDEIDGYRIPTGSVVAPLPFIIQRHPDIWPTPEMFDPERFAQNKVAGRHRQAWIPFGVGQRLCPAQEFSLMEGQLVLASILQRYQLRAISETPSATATSYMRLSGTIKSRAGVLLSIALR